MAKAQEIIAKIISGISPEDLAQKVPWKDLGSEDAVELLNNALRLPDNQQSYNLLVYLYRVSFGKDLWYSTEVLGQAIQHPNMTLVDRQAILPSLRGRLDRIKEQIAIKSPPEEELIKYWLMEATFYAVNGSMLAVNGHKADAAQNYDIAQSIFEQLGLSQQASKYRTLNKRLLTNEAEKAPPPKVAPISFELPPTRPFSSHLIEKLRPVSAPPEKPETQDVQPQESVQFETQKQAVNSSPESGELAEEKPAPSESPGQNEIQAIHTPQDQAMDRPAEPAPPLDEPVSKPTTAPLPEEGDFDSLIPRTSGGGTGIYFPLPDVWQEDGKLHVLGVDRLESDEARCLMEQIQQQSEILIGIQLQIQIYLKRRAFLERDMKLMEKRAKEIATRLAALQEQEKKATNSEE